MSGYLLDISGLFLIASLSVHAVEYSPITAKTAEFANVVNFNGQNNVAIKLTQGNIALTKQIGVTLTGEAYGALAFEALYNVASDECQKTTTRFTFGEQEGVWDQNSSHFRVMMLKGTVDPVVPFTRDQPVAISINVATNELTVISGSEHNWVSDARITNVSWQGMEMFLPRSSVAESEATDCTSQMDVTLQLYNVGLWQEKLESSTVSSTTTVTTAPSGHAKEWTIAFYAATSSPAEQDKTESLLKAIAAHFDKDLQGGSLRIGLIPYRENVLEPLPPSSSPSLITEFISSAYSAPPGSVTLPSQKLAVQYFVDSSPSPNHNFLLLAPSDIGIYGGNTEDFAVAGFQLGKLAAIAGRTVGVGGVTLNETTWYKLAETTTIERFAPAEPIDIEKAFQPPSASTTGSTTSASSIV